MGKPSRPLRQPLASISLDLDNLWSYLKIHGDPSWQNRPSYLDTFVPYVLDALGRLDLTITFFIVGADATGTDNQGYLRSLRMAGHEIGNHSHEHESWLHTYSAEHLVEEISRSQDAIEDAVGFRPDGFRGPGFSWSPTLLETLADQGFLYDASTLPTYLGPLARFYYFRTAKLDPEERQKRKELFGKLADGLRPTRPFHWQLSGNRTLLEIPVTTIPILKIPFHLSYLLYLSRFSRLLMDLYLALAISLCRLTSTPPSFLLHPLDLIGSDQVPQLSFFPGMDVSSTRKLEIFERVLTRLRRSFSLAPMGLHARSLLEGGQLRKEVPIR